MVKTLENEQTNWIPFEKIIKLATPELVDNSPFLKTQKVRESFIHDFMFMGTVIDSCVPGKRIYLYKHSETKRYMNIDDDGQCYSYKESFYQPIKTQAALLTAFEC